MEDGCCLAKERKRGFFGGKNEGREAGFNGEWHIFDGLNVDRTNVAEKDVHGERSVVWRDRMVIIHYILTYPVQGQSG
jgi:hypothetical protein